MNSPWPSVSETNFNPIISEIADIKKFDPSWEIVKKYDDEDDFTGGGVKFLSEATNYVIIGHSILGANGAWTQNQAVVAGNLVRLYKLVSGVLDQICQRRSEQAQVFVRLAFESIVNTQFLIEFYSEELVKEYIEFSFFHERDLKDRVEANIKKRNGVVLPIEDRILRSINHAFQSAGLTPDELPNKKPNNWGGKSLYKKTEALGLEQLYLVFVGGPSQSIHGAWYEIAANHLIHETPNHFIPRPDWNHPRPQIALALAQLIAGTIDRYFEFVGGDALHVHVKGRLDDLKERIMRFGQYHEEYLSSFEWPRIRPERNPH